MKRFQKSYISYKVEYFVIVYRVMLESFFFFWMAAQRKWWIYEIFFFKKKKSYWKGHFCKWMNEFVREEGAFEHVLVRRSHYSIVENGSQPIRRFWYGKRPVACLAWTPQHLHCDCKCRHSQTISMMFLLEATHPHTFSLLLHQHFSSFDFLVLVVPNKSSKNAYKLGEIQKRLEFQKKKKKTMT